MTRLFILGMLLTAAACSTPQTKEQFLDDAIRAKYGIADNQAIEYQISKESVTDEVHVVFYTAKVNSGFSKNVISDSLIYTVTGDNIFIAQ